MNQRHPQSRHTPHSGSENRHRERYPGAKFLLVPVAPLLDADGAARECPVCLEVMFEAAAHLTTTCGHTFHRRCLAPSVSRCPMCRSDLTAEDAHTLGRSLQWST